MDWGWLPQLTVSLIAGGIGWLIGWKLKERSESVKVAKQGILQKRLEAYADVMAPLIDRITSVGIKTTNPRKPFDIQEWRKKHFQLMLFGDDEVIRLWNGLWQNLFKGIDQINEDIHGHVLHIGQIVLAIRRNLGHPDTTLTETDMFAWLVRDIEQLELLKKELARRASDVKRGRK